jgi:hypothetical protein
MRWEQITVLEIIWVYEYVSRSDVGKEVTRACGSRIVRARV